VVPLTAFEAHVVNVTATIERPPSQCDALSVGYWKNHEGCSKGAGESLWTAEINALSLGDFSGVFALIGSGDICTALWTPNCPGGKDAEARFCKARAMALADELNVVTDRLHLDALIAGADDGDSAFDNLLLTELSTVREALEAVEGILVDGILADPADLRDAAHVAERIYAFYEDENPIAPQCVFSLDDVLVVEPLDVEENTSDQDGQVAGALALVDGEKDGAGHGEDGGDEGGGILSAIFGGLAELLFGDGEEESIEEVVLGSEDNATSTEEVVLEEEAPTADSSSADENLPAEGEDSVDEPVSEDASTGSVEEPIDESDPLSVDVDGGGSESEEIVDPELEPEPPAPSDAEGEPVQVEDPTPVE